MLDSLCLRDVLRLVSFQIDYGSSGAGFSRDAPVSSSSSGVAVSHPPIPPENESSLKTAVQVSSSPNRRD
jgi:hypothetical protein